jgi:hypothetical protein
MLCDGIREGGELLRCWGRIEGQAAEISDQIHSYLLIKKINYFYPGGIKYQNGGYFVLDTGYLGLD